MVIEVSRYLIMIGQAIVDKGAEEMNILKLDFIIKNSDNEFINLTFYLKYILY